MVKSKLGSSEDIFLEELVKGKARWSKLAAELKERGLNNEDELSYAEAYKILLNKFTYTEPTQIKVEE